MSITATLTDDQITRWLSQNDCARETLHFYTYVFDNNLDENDAQSLVKYLQIIGSACLLNPKCNALDGIEAFEFAQQLSSQTYASQINKLEGWLDHLETIQTENKQQIDTDITKLDFVYWLHQNAQTSTHRISLVLLQTAETITEEKDAEGELYLETISKITSLLLKKKQFDEAQKKCEKIIAYCQKKPDLDICKTYLSKTYGEMGDIQMTFNQPGKAIHYYNQGLTTALCRLQMHKTYKELKKKRDRAIHALNRRRLN